VIQRFLFRLLNSNGLGVKKVRRARIESILLCLHSGEMDIGWAAFLETYSGVLQGVVHQFEADKSAAEECFEYVCAKLSDDSFRRLKAFDPDGFAKFRTWLTAVTANLCKDWRRSAIGRRRLPESIRQLPEMDRLIFECFYWQGMTHGECLHALKSRFTQITLELISETNARLHSILSSNQRWQLSVKRGESQSIDDSSIEIEANDRGPEFHVQSEEDRRRLEKAMARLEPQQRLLLQLRYQQDLTLTEVAQLIGLSDPFKARRQIDAALAALTKAMKL
jgi:RNA polymerase sigma factor (sigma-70 family)